MTKRKINLEKLDDDQLEQTITVLSNKITKDVDILCEEMNKTLLRYGLQCKMQIMIEELPAPSESK